MFFMDIINPLPIATEMRKVRPNKIQVIENEEIPKGERL